MRGNSHVRCGAGENSEMISKNYLSLSGAKEYGITDHHIIGVLTGVIRNGKTISVNNKNYRLYVHLWCDFFHVRALILRVKNYLKRRIK